MNTSFSKPNRSGKRRIRIAFVLAASLGAFATPELHAQTVVVPNALAAKDGNTSIDVPAGPSELRIMQIFDASQFVDLSGPSFLTQCAWRLDKSAGPSTRTRTYRIYASTTTRAVTKLSTTLDDNLGANNTLVFDGTVTGESENLPGLGNTRQFDIVHPFTTPFLYDPAAGNLLLDLQFSPDTGEAVRYDLTTENLATRTVIGFGSATAPIGEFFESQPTQFTFAAPLPPSPRLQVKSVWHDGQNFLRLEWPSHAEYNDLLQTQMELLPTGWTDLEKLSGTGETFLREFPVAGPAGFYRLQRQWK